MTNGPRLPKTVLGFSTKSPESQETSYSWATWITDHHQGQGVSTGLFSLVTTEVEGRDGGKGLQGQGGGHPKHTGVSSGQSPRSAQLSQGRLGM